MLDKERVANCWLLSADRNSLSNASLHENITKKLKANAIERIMLLWLIIEIICCFLILRFLFVMS